MEHHSIHHDDRVPDNLCHHYQYLLQHSLRLSPSSLRVTDIGTSSRHGIQQNSKFLSMVLGFWVCNSRVRILEKIGKTIKIKERKNILQQEWAICHGSQDWNLGSKDRFWPKIIRSRRCPNMYRWPEYSVNTWLVLCQCESFGAPKK